jgi:transcriptional regulator with XRE-family HTH domain
VGLQHICCVADVETSNARFAERKQFYQDFGLRIKKKRLKAGFSQQGVADSVGLSRTTLTNIESGRQNVLLHTFVDIAEALGTEPKDLLPQKATVPQDVQTKLDSVLPEFRNFVKQTIGNTQLNEHSSHSPESSPNLKGNGSAKSSRRR